MRERMGMLGIDALVLSLGADLPWLTGYEAMPLERLTMLVLPADGNPSNRSDTTVMAQWLRTYPLLDGIDGKATRT